MSPTLLNGPALVNGPAPAKVRLRTERSNLRLTRRGKIVVIVIALIAIGSVALLCASTVTATDTVGPSRDVRVVTVDAGQTLWQVAAAANPQGDIRDTVDEIVQLNSLPSTAVAPGTQLSVPNYS